MRGTHRNRIPARRWMVLAILSLGLALADTALAQTEEDALRFSQRAPATGARMTGMAGAGMAVQSTVTDESGRPENTGARVSLTVMICCAELILPQKSTAVQVRVMV